MSISNKKSALRQGLLRCHNCGYITTAPPVNADNTSAAGTLDHCPRCDGELHARLPNSFQRTAALLCSAFILYIPANIFPIMIVTKFGVPEPHTIISGIVALINGGMIPIATLVFIASVLVPLIKMLGLSILLWAVQHRWQRNLRLLTVVYRLIAFVGRWSMLDIFMISILVSIVSSEALEQVLAGPAATAFAAVVVLTMLAANSFDPRLLWDRLGAH
ncbi:MAG: paraquat-inducible protein A [Methylococcaceae bacterium]